MATERLLHRPRLERFQGDTPPEKTALQHINNGSQAMLIIGDDVDLLLLPRNAGGGVLKIETGAHLLLGLMYGVALLFK